MKEKEEDDNMEINEDEKNDDKEEGKEKENKNYIINDDEENVIDYLNFTFNNLQKEEQDILNEKDIELIGRKRKGKERKLKKLPLKLLATGKKRKADPTIYQRIFNEITKSDNVTEDTIASAASKLKFSLTPENKTFFLELSRAKTSLVKHGLPNSICKQSFHFFPFIYTYNSTSVLTDDGTTWDCYYAQGFTKAWAKGSYPEYTKICEGSKIKDFSVVTDKPQVFKSINYGYCQDFYRQATGICEKTPPENELQKIKTALQNKDQGTTAFQVDTMDNKKFTFYQYFSTIMIVASNYNVDYALTMISKTVCFNSKNKLTSGMKEVKMDKQIASYINIHEMKTVDFSPSCLFANPAIQNPKMFLNVELEPNHVYNYISDAVVNNKNVFSMVQIKVPDDMVFWDNIGSFVQLMGLIKFINNGTNNLTLQLENQITELLDLYYKNRDAITAWRRLYKIFESIVLGYYDRITTKLTIDGISQLKQKATDFIMNYNYLRNDDSFSSVEKIVNLIPSTKLMRNFMLTDGAFEIVTSILKLITILESGKQKSKASIKIDELFRTIGYICVRVLYGEPNAMIPKIRSRVAFLGGPAGSMTNETLNDNIKYLVDAFKNKMIEKGNEKLKRRVLDYKEMDDLVESLIDSSLKKLNNQVLNGSKDVLMKNIKTDGTLLNSLREDILEMIKNDETIEDIKLYGDFLDNTLFNSFIKSYLALGKSLYDHTNGMEIENVLKAMRVKPGKKKNNKKFLKKKGKQRENVNLEELPIDEVIEVDIKKLTKGLALKENHTEQQFMNDADQYINGMVAPK